jgi:hypothetical protein
MKVAIISESSADEAAVARLAEAILGAALDISSLKVRHRGWPNVCQVLSNLVREIYYATDAEGVIVVVDADLSPVHQEDHDSSDPANAACRICQLGHAVARILPHLRNRPVSAAFRIAFGLAIPSIEAWLRCGADNAVSEATWNNARRQNTFPYTTADLKRAIYGNDRPSIEQETHAMIREVERLLAASQLELLERNFPVGFGMLARQVRAWKLGT